MTARADNRRTCWVVGCTNRARTERSAVVGDCISMVEAGLSCAKKKLKSGYVGSCDQYICPDCMPYMPLTGQHVLKMDAEKGTCIGIVMDPVDTGYNTRSLVGTGNKLRSGHMSYKVQWKHQSPSKKHPTAVNTEVAEHKQVELDGMAQHYREMAVLQLHAAEEEKKQRKQTKKQKKKSKRKVQESTNTPHLRSEIAADSVHASFLYLHPGRNAQRRGPG